MYGWKPSDGLWTRLPYGSVQPTRKRKEEAERREEGLVVSQPAITQSRELTSPTGAAQGASAIRTAFEALP